MKLIRNRYEKKTNNILHTIALYKTLKPNQIYQMNLGKEENTKSTLKYLIKQKRIVYDDTQDIIAINEAFAKNPTWHYLNGFYVLLDFMDTLEYHSSSTYPITITFFAKGEQYDIIYFEEGEEMMTNLALSLMKKQESKKLVLIQKTEQIPKIKIEGKVTYCILDENKKVNYYNT